MIYTDSRIDCRSIGPSAMIQVSLSSYHRYTVLVQNSLYPFLLHNNTLTHQLSFWVSACLFVCPFIIRFSPVLKSRGGTGTESSTESGPWTCIPGMKPAKKSNRKDLRWAPQLHWETRYVRTYVTPCPFAVPTRARLLSFCLIRQK